MNTPNPLVPQGSLLEQQKSRNKSNLVIAVFTILAVHVVLFGGLLMQGCKRERAGNAGTTNAIPGADTNLANLFANTNLPPSPTNAPYVSETPTNPPALTNAPVAPETPAATATEYKIVAHDTFAKIAKAHGLPTKVLLDANPNVDPKKLRPGQVIQIPAPKATPKPGVGLAETGTSEGGGSAYTVKSGDNLTSIARAHATTVKAIQALNNMKTTRLNVGQKLKLPPPKTTNAPAEPAPRSAATNSARI